MGRPFVLGLDCALYYLPSAGRSAAFPVNNFKLSALSTTVGEIFTEVSYTRDVTLNLDKNLADLSSRASGGWAQQVSTLKNASIDFQILWRPDDAVFTEMLARYLDGCPVCMCIMDGEVFWSGTTTVANASSCVGITPYVVSGLYADFTVNTFSRGEPLQEGVTADINIVPTVGAIRPQWFSISDTGVCTLDLVAIDQAAT